MGRLTGFGNGLAICSTPTTSFRTESKALSAVMSGTTTNSTAFLETKGAISGRELNSWIEASRRTETRARYPAFRVSMRTANPMKPVAPVIWKGCQCWVDLGGMEGRVTRMRSPAMVSVSKVFALTDLYF